MCTHRYGGTWTCIHGYGSILTVQTIGQIVSQQSLDWSFMGSSPGYSVIISFMCLTCQYDYMYACTTCTYMYDVCSLNVCLYMDSMYEAGCMYLCLYVTINARLYVSLYINVSMERCMCDFKELESAPT